METQWKRVKTRGKGPRARERVASESHPHNFQPLKEQSLPFTISSLASTLILLFLPSPLNGQSMISLRWIHGNFLLCCPFPSASQYCWFSSVQFSSITQSCPTLCDPVNRSTPGLPDQHQLPEFTQTHVHQVGDAIQPSHPLSSPSSPAFDLSQHQGLFQ